MLPERDAEGYGGPRLVGTIGIGGMGWSVYGGSGPAVAMKTWGQGPGGATALYRDQRDAFAGFHNGRRFGRTRFQTSSQRSCSANLT